MIVINAFIKKNANRNGCTALAMAALNKVVHRNNRRT